MKKSKSWKTTLSGVLALVPMILHTLFPEKVTLDVAAAITAFFGAIGLIVAKDGQVTGGDRRQ